MRGRDEILFGWIAFAVGFFALFALNSGIGFIAYGFAIVFFVMGGLKAVGKDN